MRARHLQWAAILLASAFATAEASAQTDTAPAPVPAAPPPASAPGAARTVPEQIAPPAAPLTTSSLAKPDDSAVLVPAPVDPGIKTGLKTQTKDPMPVITPPAAGGAPGAVAK